MKALSVGQSRAKLLSSLLIQWRNRGCLSANQVMLIQQSFTWQWVGRYQLSAHSCAALAIDTLDMIVGNTLVIIKTLHQWIAMIRKKKEVSLFWPRIVQSCTKEKRLISLTHQVSIYTHQRTHTYTQTFTHTYAHTYTHIYMHIRTLIHRHTYMYSSHERS